MDEFPLIGERWASLEGGETVGVEGKSKQSTLQSLMATVGLSIRAQAFVVISRAELPQPPNASAPSPPSHQNAK